MVKKSRDSFIADAIKKHRGKYDYSKVEYKGCMKKVCIICPEHGEFWQTPNSHLKGRGCPICKKYRKLSVRIGDVYESPIYGKYEVISISNNASSYVKFLSTGTIKLAKNQKIVNGHVKDYMTPIIENVGYLGGKLDEKVMNTASYNTWRHMLIRCYDKKYQEKQPTYIGCTVFDEWKSFAIFKKWFNENYVEGYELDKDILVKGNKVYSPKTCCFVPAYINTLFTKSNASRGNFPIGVARSKNGLRFIANITINNKTKHLGAYDTIEEAFFAYKQAKEEWIKEVANKWKNKIAPNVYEALMNYQVEIRD